MGQGRLLVSAAGSRAYNVALLAFVFDRTHSLAWVGAAGLVSFIASLLRSTHGGLSAERIEQVRLLRGADLGSGDRHALSRGAQHAGEHPARLAGDRQHLTSAAGGGPRDALAVR